MWNIKFEWFFVFHVTNVGWHSARICQGLKIISKNMKYYLIVVFLHKINVTMVVEINNNAVFQLFKIAS